MSEGGVSAQDPAAVRGARAPAREPRGGEQLRLIETIVLVLVALLLAIATVNDVVRQTHINHRLVADLRTWRAYSGHDFHNLSVQQDRRSHSTRDVVCGNTTPGAPKERVQLCLVMTGPVRRGLRTVRSGWYLPPRVEDERRYRFACFGLAEREHFCRR